MAIITLATYKTLAGISGTSQDTRISAIIPLVQADFIELNNYAFGTDLDPVVESWPSGCELAVTQAITYMLTTLGSNTGLKSETQGGYSYTKEELGSFGYPVSIEKALTKWKRVSVKNPQVMTQFRDRRQLALKDLAEGREVYSVPGFPL